jgi:hypothetical protein
MPTLDELIADCEAERDECTALKAECQTSKDECQTIKDEATAIKDESIQSITAAKNLTEDGDKDLKTVENLLDDAKGLK